MNRVAGRDGDAGTAQLEARLKAQEAWKLEQDRNVMRELHWKHAQEKSSEDTVAWRGQQLQLTEDLKKELTDQRDRADAAQMRSQMLEQRMAWQEKLSNDQAEANRVAEERSSESRRKGAHDQMQSAEMEARLALQEKQHAKERARNRALEARINELERQLGSSGSDAEVSESNISKSEL
jgi:hypothetical protein